MKIKISRNNLRILTSNWCLLGIYWRMPLRLIILAKITNKYMLITSSVLNVFFNIGDIIEYDAKGIQFYLEIFGKGFKYTLYKYDNRIKFKVRRFEWIK